MEINPIEVITAGIQRGLKNFAALVVNGILFALTAWIPYINVGTMIGMTVLPAKVARDEGLSMTEIFNPDYRKYMGEFFIAMILVVFGVVFGYLFGIIPGYAIGLAWSFAFLLLVDKGMEPLAAIKKSNDLTYGHKLKMFLTYLLFGLAVGLAVVILSFIGGLIHEVVALILILAVYILIFPVLLGIQAEFYKRLVLDRQG